MFRFWDEKRWKSLGLCTIPAEIVGKRCTITFDVIDTNIPLLLLKTAMRKAEVLIDPAEDKIMWKGKKVSIQVTSSGHYSLPFLEELTHESKADRERLLDESENVSKEEENIDVEVVLDISDTSSEREDSNKV